MENVKNPNLNHLEVAQLGNIFDKFKFDSASFSIFASMGKHGVIN